jgi:hypothetical protein
MARYGFTVRRGDKLILTCGTLRFFGRGEVVVTAKKKPEHVQAKGKRLTKPGGSG